jgi:hypothetical protein
MAESSWDAVLGRLDTFWNRTPQPELGRAIRLLRQEFASRREFIDRMAEVSGQLLGADDSLVYRWEEGGTSPRPHYRRILRVLCEVQLVGMDNESRRAFLSRLVAVSGGILSLPLTIQVDVAPPSSPALEPWERLAYVLRHPSRIDEQSLRQLERTTVALQRQEGELTPAAMLPEVRAHLQLVTELLRYGSFGSRTRQWLCSIAGEIAGLAGWLMWELDDGDAATAYFRSGIQAASEAGHRALGAYLVGCFACQPIYRERPEVRLRHLGQRTFGFTQGDAAPATRAWLAVLEAEANALLGRAGDCFQALNRAEAIASQAAHREQAGRPAIPSSQGAFFSDAYLAADEGVARLKLGRSAEAAEILEPLLASLNSNRLKNWYWLYPILADAYIDQGHIERACELASEALVRSFEARIMTNLPLIAKLQEKLSPYRDNLAVRHLGEELETVKRIPPGLE